MSGTGGIRMGTYNEGEERDVSDSDGSFGWLWAEERVVRISACGAGACGPGRAMVAETWGVVCA